MTNGTDAVNGNQMESLATSLKSYITSSVSNLNTVVGTQSVLGSTATTFDGSLWLSASTPPVLKLYYGGNTYSFATELDNVVDYRNATTGQTATVTTNGYRIYGSAYADSITVNANDCTLNCGAGNDSIKVNEYYTGNVVSLVSGANYVINDGTNSTIYGGTGNDTIWLSVRSRYSVADLRAGGNNFVYMVQPGETVICGGGNDSVELYTYTDYGDYVIKNFSNSDMIRFGSRSEWKDSYPVTVSGSTIRIEHWYADFSTKYRVADIVLENCTATQFHISTYSEAAVYTLEGSQLVKAS